MLPRRRDFRPTGCSRIAKELSEEFQQLFGRQFSVRIASPAMSSQTRVAIHHRWRQPAWYLTAEIGHRFKCALAFTMPSEYRKTGYLHHTGPHGAILRQSLLDQERSTAQRAYCRYSWKATRAGTFVTRRDG